MPKRLLVIALVFCAVGAACIWVLVDRGPMLAADVGILALPLGIGLLLGRPRARSWARGCLAVLCVLVLAAGVVRALFTAVALLAPGADSVQLGGVTLQGWSALLGLVLATLLVGAGLYAMQRQLDAGVVRAYCGTH